ncbi:hypothetical protein ACP4OV_012886 [Aristida adscensionis]
MAATASLTATASATPVLLKASPPPLLPLGPVSRRCKLQSVRTKATEKDQTAKKPQKYSSIVCKDCEGNVELSNAPNARGMGLILLTISMADLKLERYAGFAEESVKYYAGTAMELAS